MSNRNYRRCGGCHIPRPYCDCKDYGLIDMDTKAAKYANVMQPAYFGTKNFGFYITTEDGVSIHAPQFQSIGYDGSNYYVFVCDKNDEKGCVIKYRADWSLVKVGPCIDDIGHAKGCYNFGDNYIYIAQRRFAGDWNARGMHKVDPGTLASIEFNNVGNNSITAFVQTDKKLYCVGSDSTKFYEVKKIDVAAGTIERELVADLYIAGDFYDELSPKLGIQTWYFDGRVITAIRNNPQFAIVYDTISKKVELSHIGDVSDGRFIGEIEGAFTWYGETTLMSACDVQDPIADANGVNYADFYIQFWYYNTSRGASGSLDVRENTHPTYSIVNKFYDDPKPTTNRTIVVDAGATNFYCNGSILYPFHSVHEALAYFRYHPTSRGIQFMGDYDGFIRAFNISCDLDTAGNGTVRLRFTDNIACNWRIKDITLHDVEFYRCNINLLHGDSFEDHNTFDKYYRSGAQPDTAISKRGYLGVFEDSIIWCDAKMTSGGVNAYEDFITTYGIVSNCNVAVSNIRSLHE